MGSISISIGVVSIKSVILVLRTPYCGYIDLPALASGCNTLNRSYKDYIISAGAFCLAYLPGDNPSGLNE